MPVPKGFTEKATDFPTSKCAPGSFRVKVVSKAHRLLICCPKGKWNAKRKRCRVGTRATKSQTRKRR
jgi:hypothetical protein